VTVHGTAAALGVGYSDPIPHPFEDIAGRPRQAGLHSRRHAPEKECDLLGAGGAAVPAPGARSVPVEPHGNSVVGPQARADGKPQPADQEPQAGAPVEPRQEGRGGCSLAVAQKPEPYPFPPPPPRTRRPALQIPGSVHQGAEGNQRGTSGLAGPTFQAICQMAPELRGSCEGTLGQALDQGDAPAR
jgi:hypothetical protein